ITVRELLRLLPDGIGVAVDPERASGMTATASYVAQLKRYVAAFPPGSEVRLADWAALPDGVREALSQTAAQLELIELRAFTYAVDDSPLLGCLAYVGAPGAETAGVVDALGAALSAATDLVALGLPTVNILSLAEVPDEVRAALGDAQVIHRRQRSRRWRR
ncbi:MAG: hypothetical protein ABW075_00265, partial [Aeromicrobium sp.]